MPGRPALRTGQTLARHPQRLTVVDPRGEGDLDRTLDFNLRASATCPTRGLGDAAHALAAGTGGLQEERSARMRDLTGALAARADRALAAFGPAPRARLARSRITQRN